MLVCQLCMYYDFITSVSDIGYTGIRNIFLIGVGRVGGELSHRKQNGW